MHKAPVAALAVSVLIVGAAVAQPWPASKPPPGVDMTGVWMGMTPSEAPPQYRNSPYPYPPPFTPEGAKMSKYWSTPNHNLGAQCLPGGGPVGSVNAGTLFPLEIIQKDNQFTVIPEYEFVPRRIYTDGRPHPGPDDLEKTWMGHSIGRWEGDTLVADTIGTHAGSMNGSGAAVILEATDKDPRMPYSAALHLTERYHLLEGGKYLEDDLTIDDPALYTQPFTVKRFWRRAPELSILEYVCDENPRDRDEGVAPDPNPPPEAR